MCFGTCRKIRQNTLTMKITIDSFQLANTVPSPSKIISEDTITTHFHWKKQQHIQLIKRCQTCLPRRTKVQRYIPVVFFVFFFVDQSATRPKLPLSQILSHAARDVYSPKPVETLINLIPDTDFRGKKLKTQRSSKIIFFHQKFSSEHIHIYLRLNRR